jgi:hypothetical protein
MVVVKKKHLDMEQVRAIFVILSGRLKMCTFVALRDQVGYSSLQMF